MPNLTSVGLTAGVPTSGTGTVSTLDNLVGTAGSASAQVLTIQGVTSMTPVKVDGSGVTQPVSGNITNAGTFAVQLTGATNNINNIAGTVSLPTGAATAAKQPALGTAGTPSSDVITVQGAASMTPLQTTSSPAVGTSTLTRPAGTPTYTAGQIVASSATAGSIVVPSFSVSVARRLTGVRLKSNHTTGLDQKQFRCRVFTTTAPTYTNGDNAAYALATGAANWVGKFEFTMEQQADGAFGAAAPFDRPEITLPAATYYWDLQTIDGFTAQASKTFTFEPEFAS